MYDRLFIDQALSITKTEGLFPNPSLYQYIQSIDEYIFKGNGLSPLISYVVIHVFHYMVHAFTYKVIKI